MSPQESALEALPVARAPGTFRTLSIRIGQWGAFGYPGAPAWSRVLSVLLLAACPWLARTDLFALPIAVMLTLWLLVTRLMSSLAGSRFLILSAAGWISFLACFPFYVLAWGAAILLSPMFAWTSPWWARAVLAGSLALGLAHRRLPGRFRLPLSVPFCFWIGVCGWGGWFRAERYVDCDDFLAVQAPMQVVVPSRTDLDQCHSGESLPLGRFPRIIRDLPDGRRYVFTDQAPRDWPGPPAPEDTVTGLFCSTPVAGTKHPDCIGGPNGRSHGIAEIPSRDELVAGSWLIPHIGTRAEGGGRVFVTKLEDPTRLVATHDFPDSNHGGAMLYMPASDSLFVSGDIISPIRVHASDFSPYPSGTEHQFPMLLAWDYDQARDEGLACGLVTRGPAGMTWTNVVAFRGSTLAVRPLIDGSHHRALLAGMATGCALDTKARKAYVMFFNLGLLARLDYDTGRMEKLRYVGAGLRNLTFDPKRGRLYVTDYAGHDIVALDPATFREVRRWRVGRYPRDVYITRDGSALLTGTTVGLVKAPLDGPPPDSQPRP